VGQQKQSGRPFEPELYERPDAKSIKVRLFIQVLHCCDINAYDIYILDYLVGCPMWSQHIMLLL
jgi:hypothetical protein